MIEEMNLVLAVVILAIGIFVIAVCLFLKGRVIKNSHLSDLQVQTPTSNQILHHDDNVGGDSEEQVSSYAVNIYRQVQHRVTEYLYSPTYKQYGSKHLCQECEKKLNSLLLDAIHLFKYQRIEGDQFAFLFLEKNTDFTKMTFRILKKTVTELNDATNSKCVSYPPTKNMLGNYICARPDKSNPRNKIHAEIVLLRRLSSLKVSYERRGCERHQKCRTIILYTWLLPCLRCAEKIVSILGSPGKYDKYFRILAYTSATVPNTVDSSHGAPVGTSKQKIESKLEGAGILVFKTQRTTL